MFKLKLEVSIGGCEPPVVTRDKLDVYHDVQMKEESRTYPSTISSQSATRGTTIRDVVMYGMTLYNMLHQYLQ